MKSTFAALFVSVLAAPALLSEMVSVPRAAYILGRWFDGPHDGYRAICAGVDDESPSIDGHESVSVAVTCGYETSLSSVLAGLDWVVQTASSDATVIVPDNLRGHQAVEGRLDSMRECGMNVPGALVPAPVLTSHGSPTVHLDFLSGFVLCAALIALFAGSRRLFAVRAASPLLRRHTWEMSARDRKDLHAYAGQAADQADARARRESFKISRPAG